MIRRPDSLFSRLMVALLAVVGLTVTIAGVLIVRERQEFAFWAGEASDFVAVMTETAEFLADLSETQRDAAIQALQDEPPSIDTQFQRRPAPPQEFVQSALAAYERTLERRLGPEYDVDARLSSNETDDFIPIIREGPGQRRFERRNARDDDDEEFDDDPFGGDAGREINGPRGFEGNRRGRRQLDVSIGLPDGSDLMFRAPIPRPAQNVRGPIFLQLIVLTLVLGTVLFFMTRTITRPLSGLAKAAEAAGRGARIEPLPEVGARELREATRAFNAMQERLYRYLDSRTSVLAAMSHDLRTPLTRIRLRVESLEDESLRNRFIADLDEMNGMISGALSLFRGLNEEEPESECDIAELLGNLRDDFAEIGVTVDVEGDALRPIRLRPLAIKRCLTNLISNAAKFASNPRVLVEDGASLVLRVCDDGPGIPDEDLERVFEPFYRVESSRNPETGGTGLGLSIARDIAQAHGGSLELRNRSPHGLEAVLSLPRAPQS
jgi:signal transduction histidine kinase